MDAATRPAIVIDNGTGLPHLAGRRSLADAQHDRAAGRLGDWAWSINQARSFRWNLTASVARPNLQGSYHYDQINITRTIKVMVSRGHIDGKLHYGFNDISHRDTETPLKFAEYFNVTHGVFSYNQMGNVPPAVNGPLHVIPNVITAELHLFDQF
ncbi:SKU5 similar 13 [Zea mays]|uniref:SKU5 similar 13 n=1 Tax=Zea mays TaxID=4577 RepID=A0A1D6P7F4_MAIZE|nr:SKU5 similar 13 [Zea mays]